MDILLPLGLSIYEAKTQRVVKRPRMPGFKVTRCHATDIKMIRKCDLPRLRALPKTPQTLPLSLSPFCSATPEPQI
jgi:hypothetical protein